VLIARKLICPGKKKFLMAKRAMRPKIVQKIATISQSTILSR
jgi:hypothetical protein